MWYKGMQQKLGFIEKPWRWPPCNDRLRHERFPYYLMTWQSHKRQRCRAGRSSKKINIILLNPTKTESSVWVFRSFEWPSGLMKTQWLKMSHSQSAHSPYLGLKQYVQRSFHAAYWNYINDLISPPNEDSKPQGQKRYGWGFQAAGWGGADRQTDSRKYIVACQVHPTLVKIPSHVTRFCVSVVN